MNSKIIAVDFDGTLCENKWPEIGEANEDMIYYLRKRQAEGDKLILWTCRVGDMLRKAMRTFLKSSIALALIRERYSPTNILMIVIVLSVPAEKNRIWNYG